MQTNKPRLSILSVLLHPYLVESPAIRYVDIISLTIGTALAAGGAAALNQWMERREDALMARTASPRFQLVDWSDLPSFLESPCPPRHLFPLGRNKSLGSHTNLATLAIYLLLYTPMKKRSPYATESVQSLMHYPSYWWVAAEDSHHLWLDFIWYFVHLAPHFMAIVEFPRATPRVDSNCTNLEIRTVKIQSLIYSLLLTIFVFLHSY